MKLFVFASAITLFALPAFSKTLTCQVDEAVMGGSKLKVPVVTAGGAELVEEKPVKFKKVVVSAKHILGDQYESQSILIMKLNDVVSTANDVKGARYELTKGDIRFQCWFQ